MVFLQKVLEITKEHAEAQKALARLLDSDENKKSSFTYRSAVMQSITNARVDTARRQFVANQRIRAMQRPDTFRWWDGVEGALYEKFKVGGRASGAFAVPSRASGDTHVFVVVMVVMVAVLPLPHRWCRTLPRVA